jgi:hypothetical protein
MTNDPGAALSLLCLGTGLGLPAQAVHCFAAHPAQSGTPFSGNRLNTLSIDFYIVSSVLAYAADIVVLL